MQAMILAAGFGTRLRPYSLVRPKPLFPILNRPLLLATIDRLKAAGFTDITVNCHHLAEQIAAAVAAIPEVSIQCEQTILGTGGGLRRALAHLQDEPLLVSNGDIYHSIDFADVYRQHRQSGAGVTMVLHDCPRFNTVSVDGERVVGFGSAAPGTRLLAYTGVQVINPALLATIPDGTYSCIIEHYRRLLRAGHWIAAFQAADIHWTDMGTSADYLKLHEALLTGVSPVWPELGGKPDTPLLIHEEARLEAGSRMEAWACIGKASLAAGARVRRAVVWDGSVVPAGADLSDCIVTPILPRQDRGDELQEGAQKV